MPDSRVLVKRVMSSPANRDQRRGKGIQGVMRNCKELVECFYGDIWNRRDYAVADDMLAAAAGDAP